MLKDGQGFWDILQISSINKLVLKKYAVGLQREDQYPRETTETIQEHFYTNQRGAKHNISPKIGT